MNNSGELGVRSRRPNGGGARRTWRTAALVAGAAVLCAGAPVRVGPYPLAPSAPTAPVAFVVAGVTPQYVAHGRVGPETFRGLTDTLLLVQLDPRNNRIRTLSIPRDTRVHLPGVGWSRVNAALPRLGPDGMRRVVENLTGVPTRGYVLVNLAGLRRVTDLAGGVSVYVAQDMHYDDHAGKLHIHLGRGVQRLNGHQAEGYVRYRRDALGDLGRVQRQQVYLRALAGRMTGPEGLARFAAAGAVLNGDVRTNLGAADVNAVAGMLLGGARVESLLLPGRFATIGSSSYWAVDDHAARRTLVNFGSRRSAGHVPADPRALRVAVVSTGATAVQVAAVRARLVHAGYRNVFVTASGVPNGRQSAVLSNGSLGDAHAVRRAAGFGEPRVSGEGALNADVTVWVGADHR